jgi:hypothetical protein
MDYGDYEWKIINYGKQRSGKTTNTSAGDGAGRACPLMPKGAKTGCLKPDCICTRTRAPKEQASWPDSLSAPIRPAAGLSWPPRGWSKETSISAALGAGSNVVRGSRSLRRQSARRLERQRFHPPLNSVAAERVCDNVSIRLLLLWSAVPITHCAFCPMRPAICLFEGRNTMALTRSEKLEAIRQNGGSNPGARQ